MKNEKTRQQTDKISLGRLLVVGEQLFPVESKNWNLDEEKWRSIAYSDERNDPVTIFYRGIDFKIFNFTFLSICFCFVFFPILSIRMQQ